MGSRLGPTLADIIMTELENIVIKPILASGNLKFYARYVDGTLVLSKPSDIPLILLKLNCF
jgi:protein involved in ribonucleotide reduction